MRNRKNIRESIQLSIQGSHLIKSASLASFTAEGLLVDRPKVYGLKGWMGFLAWTAWILVILAGPVQTSAYSDRTEPTSNVCRAH
jgi:hypothetical protein